MAQIPTNVLHVATEFHAQYSEGTTHVSFRMMGTSMRLLRVALQYSGQGQPYSVRAEELKTIYLQLIVRVSQTPRGYCSKILRCMERIIGTETRGNSPHLCSARSVRSELNGLGRVRRGSAVSGLIWELK